MAALVGQLLAGLSATLLMEQASGAIYARQSEESRRREEELRPEMPTSVLVRKLAAGTGLELSEGLVSRLGTSLHYAFGAAGGPAAAALAGRGQEPLRAGLAVATAMSLAVDEGLNTLLGLTPPPGAFPAVAHLRGDLAHLVYGASPYSPRGGGGGSSSA
jgi:hypothetical protein